jgi:hypothetical protein
VQLARFNPIGLDGSRPGDPVLAGPRDPREPPAVRVLLDVIAESVPLAGRVSWSREPALYREHAAFVTASAGQAREVLACGARAIMIGADQGAGARTPGAGDTWSAAALRGQVDAVRAERPLTQAEVVPALREIFTAHATPVRLMALARLTGLPGGLVAGRQLAVLARADDAAAAAALGASLARQRVTPAELVISVGAPDAETAELSGRAVAAAVGELADRGTAIRMVPWVSGAAPGGQPGWLSRAAHVARSPWVVPWPADVDCPASYLLDLACARECSQADAVGYAGAAYAFVPSLEPALARREFFTSGDTTPDTRHGSRLFSVS